MSAPLGECCIILLIGSGFVEVDKELMSVPLYFILSPVYDRCKICDHYLIDYIKIHTNDPINFVCVWS